MENKEEDPVCVVIVAGSNKNSMIYVNDACEEHFKSANYNLSLLFTHDLEQEKLFENHHGVFLLCDKWYKVSVRSCKELTRDIIELFQLKSCGQPVEYDEGTLLLLTFVDVNEATWMKMGLNDVADKVYDGFYDWNIQTHDRYMSPGFWKMLGYKPEEKDHLESEWKSVLHPEDFKVIQKNLQKHISSRGQERYHQIVRYIHRDGHYVWVICRGSVVEWGEDGSGVRLVGTHVEVTDWFGMFLSHFFNLSILYNKKTSIYISWTLI